MASRTCTSCRELLSRRWGSTGCSSMRNALRQPNLRTSSISIARIPEQTRGLRTTPSHRNEDATAATGAESDRKPSMLKSLLSSRLEGQNTSYEIYNTANILYKACAKQADYKISEQERKDEAVKLTADGEELGTGEGQWHEEFKLPATFSTWSQVTMLHMYLFMVRMRNLDKTTFQSWQQQLTDHFFNDAELRMDITHNIASRGVRQRYLRDLFLIWRGIIVAYDEGLVKGDAVLAAAVWRNLFRGREDVDLRELAAIVSWMRLTLRNLDKLGDVGIMQTCLEVLKASPKKELLSVDPPTQGLNGGDIPVPDAASSAAPAKTATSGKVAKA